ncbi:hypothetical protein AcV5_004426 [Taiwanofungus camphoratus]|nr:hypothetical protein AcV5_004426 [Antrodia cinnamomea]
MYESEAIDAELSLLLSALTFHGRSIPTRQRWSAFNADHEPVAPFTSLAIRIICDKSHDLETFRWLCRVARTKLDDWSYIVEWRHLFSREIREAYNDWVSLLSWNVAFQVEALARSHIVDMKTLLTLRTSIDNMLLRKGPTMTSAFLRDFTSQSKALIWFGGGSYESQESQLPFRDLFDRSRRAFFSKPVPLTQQASPDNFDCLHLTVTPTTWYLDGPYPERSNRVMRRYAANQDSFLRVSFLDETRLTYRFDREVDGRSFVNRRVKSLLLSGITIAGRQFQFLAYSQSALKEHAVWFVKPFMDPTHGLIDASTIIAGLGSFQDLAFDRKLIYCPARYAARISQAFTATDSSISVETEEVIYLDDIHDSDHRYCFTDGVGTVSPELAREIWNELRAKRRRARRIKTYPRSFQIRFMGSKGMLSVDYKLSGRAVGIRPSMVKFDAPTSLEIEIARAFDRPGRYYLNRPLIMLLEGLGVPYEAFKTLQDDAVQDAQNSVTSLEKSARLLEAYGLGASFRLTSAMLSLHKLGVGPLTEDMFWQQMMDFAVNHVLRELKHHARIPVPDGWSLVGVADIHGFLEEGEIFACIHDPNETEPIYLEGPTLVSRSPTIHPGDVQLAVAIGRPPQGSPFAIESLRNSVVFSTKGERPLPSCLGGGDLDGDVYNVTAISSFRPTKIYQAASYHAAPRKLVDHPSTMEDVADFVAEYIISDTLGIIAITWLLIADESAEGILDKDCLKLAQLHSDAVDYPKTGQPVPIQNIPKCKLKTRPDWNAPETLTGDTSNYYESIRAIGRLFRAIDLPALNTVRNESRFQRRQTADGNDLTFDDIIRDFYSSEPRADDNVRLVVQHRISEFIAIREEDVDRSVILGLWELFGSYVSQLRAICADHTLSHTRAAILTEEEAVIGSIVAKCSQPRRRKDLMSHLREQTSTLVSNVRAEISGDEETPAEQSLERAWVAYRLAHIEDVHFGARSFAWIALGEIFDAIKDIEEADRRSQR